MICDGILQPMHPDRVFPLKSLAKSSSVTPTFRQQRHSTASHQNFNHQTFCIIHPFHPYRNIEFEVNHVRRIPGELRVFFFNTKGQKTSVPIDWTDLGPKDPFVAVSAGRALFRVEDLLGLVRIVEEIHNANRK